ncbi:MAG: acetate kinase [Methylotenera sp.]|nr:MAG: acetate kinase [Methylotenera sp.]
MEQLSILIFNTGSSSLKFELFESINHDLQSVIRGKVDIGGLSIMDWNDGDTHTQIHIEAENHAQAASWILDWLQNLWPFGSLLDHLDIVAHRIGQGGNAFFSPQLVTDKVLAQLEESTRSAPLHNPNALAVMRITREKLPGYVQTFAVFDTAFFYNLPQHVGYALPESLIKKYGIRRYGFHGIAHRYMIERHEKIAKKPVNDSCIISFQLGHSCSVTASRNGKAVDTSMGYTPLEGLMMGTRAGDIDPGILIDLLFRGMTVDELINKLNHHSGLIGITKYTTDMRELLMKQETNADLRLAIDMFCHRARRYLGAYMAILNGADAVIFGGGIGEHSPEIRKRICDGMSWCGLLLDERRNQLAVGSEMLISSDLSRVGVYVLPVNEEIIMAEDVKNAFMNYKSKADSYIN